MQTKNLPWEGYGYFLEPHIIKNNLQLLEMQSYPSVREIACVAGVNGEGKGSKNAGEGGLGARDEGTPATKETFV